ncbi:MAG: hypothetical protein ACR2OV_14435, partial [Hyphomicrobiaceae bacterium]
MLLASFVASVLAIELLGLVVPTLSQGVLAQGKGKGQAKKAQNQAKNLAKKVEQQANKTPFVESPSTTKSQGASKSNHGQNKKTKSREKAGTQNGSEIDDPPSTVVEFFKRLVQPKPSSKPR